MIPGGGPAGAAVPAAPVPAVRSVPVLCRAAAACGAPGGAPGHPGRPAVLRLLHRGGLLTETAEAGTEWYRCLWGGGASVTFYSTNARASPMEEGVGGSDPLTFYNRGVDPLASPDFLG